MADICRDWLTDQPWTAALLRLVTQVISQSFALQLKIDILICHFVCHIGWHQLVIAAFRLNGIGQYGIQKNVYISVDRIASVMQYG